MEWCVYRTAADKFCIIKLAKMCFRRAYFKHTWKEWMYIMEDEVYFISFLVTLEKKNEINKASERLIGLICPALNAPAICPRYNHNAALTELFEGWQLV